MCGTSAGSNALICQMVTTDGKPLMEHHRKLVEVTRTNNTDDLHDGALVYLLKETSRTQRKRTNRWSKVQTDASRPSSKTAV